MSRSLDTLLRPSLLAVAIAFCTPLISSQLIAAEQASSVRAYDLPAAPLASTLNQIASQAGLALSLNPSLAAGNIGAKIAQRMGNYHVLGPLIQGLRLPMHDLSRGCSMDDMVQTTLLAMKMSGLTAAPTAAGTRKEA